MIRYIFLLVGLFISTVLSAHEQWCLTPKQFLLMSQLASPDIFSKMGLINSIVILIAFIVILFLIFFYRRRYFFMPALEKKLTHYQPYSSFIIRMGLVVTFIIAAFGLIPRYGFPPYIPTYLMPDLQLILLPRGWSWLQSFQIMLAFIFAVGIFTRMAGIILILSTFLGLYLFQVHMVAYLGFLLGIGLYLVIEGGGKLAAYSSLHRSSKNSDLDSISILRIFTALNFIYLSIFYKFMRPNLDIEILIINNAYTLYLPVDIFSFCMAIVELACGLLLLLGIYTRFIATFLFFIFILFAINIKENLLLHSFIYGILIALIINGSSSRQLIKD